jgi:predicted component of type VI protein secretion system
LRIKSAEISRRHCLLSIHDGYVSIEDLDSVNGTFLNGRRVVGKQTVRPGDSLEVGPLRFTVEYEITQAALDRLNQQAGEGEDLDVLPLAEAAEGPNPFEFAKGDKQTGSLPDAEQSTDLISPPPPEPSAPAEGEDEALPILEELDEGGDWHLPPSGDLRDILSEMEDPKARKRPESH